MQENLEIKKYLEENGISQAHVGNRAGINLTKLNLSLNGICENLWGSWSKYRFFLKTQITGKEGGGVDGCRKAFKRKRKAKPSS